MEIDLRESFEAEMGLRIDDAVEFQLRGSWSPGRYLGGGLVRLYVGTSTTVRNTGLGRIRFSEPTRVALARAQVAIADLRTAQMEALAALEEWSLEILFPAQEKDATAKLLRAVDRIRTAQRDAVAATEGVETVRVAESERVRDLA